MTERLAYDDALEDLARGALPVLVPHADGIDLGAWRPDPRDLGLLERASPAQRAAYVCHLARDYRARTGITP